MNAIAIYVTVASALFGMLAIVFRMIVNITKESTIVKVSVEYLKRDLEEVKGDVKEMLRAVRNP